MLQWFENTVGSAKNRGRQHPQIWSRQKTSQNTGRFELAYIIVLVYQRQSSIPLPTANGACFFQCHAVPADQSCCPTRKVVKHDWVKTPGNTWNVKDIVFLFSDLNTFVTKRIEPSVRNALPTWATNAYGSGQLSSGLWQKISAWRIWWPISSLAFDCYGEASRCWTMLIKGNPLNQNVYKRYLSQQGLGPSILVLLQVAAESASRGLCWTVPPDHCISCMMSSFHIDLAEATHGPWVRMWCQRIFSPSCRFVRHALHWNVVQVHLGQLLVGSGWQTMPNRFNPSFVETGSFLQWFLQTTFSWWLRGDFMAVVPSCPC